MCKNSLQSITSKALHSAIQTSIGNPINSTMAICFKKRFHLTAMDKRFFDAYFEGNQTQDGLMSEEKVNAFLSERLSDYDIAKIWELVDQDNDGFLDRYEYRVASHLAVRAVYYDDEIPDQVVTYLCCHRSIILNYIAASTFHVPGEGGLSSPPSLPEPSEGKTGQTKPPLPNSPAIHTGQPPPHHLQLSSRRIKKSIDYFKLFT